MRNQNEVSTILKMEFSGIAVVNLLAMINSIHHVSNAKKTNWDSVLETVRKWSGQQLKDVTSREIQEFYTRYLIKIPNYDRYFIVDKIQDVKTKKQDLYVLVDWKYFPPSDPMKAGNWTTINLVDYDQIRLYLLNESNQRRFREELDKLPQIYAEKLALYLDDNFYQSTCISQIMIKQKQDRKDDQREQNLKMKQQGYDLNQTDSQNQQIPEQRVISLENKLNQTITALKLELNQKQTQLKEVTLQIQAQKSKMEDLISIMNISQVSLQKTKILLLSSISETKKNNQRNVFDFSQFASQ